MTLEIVPVRGKATWWIWLIRSEAGVVVDQSKVKFLPAVAAESEGNARLAVLRDA